MSLFWELAIVAGIAAAPWGEVLVAIPVGAALGVNLVIAAPVAVIANLVPVFILLTLTDRLSARRPSQAGNPRRQRAERFFDRWGVVGLSLLAPLITGVYVATLVLAYYSVPRGRIIAWMALSIISWGAVIAALTELGISIFS